MTFSTPQEKAAAFAQSELKQIRGRVKILTDRIPELEVVAKREEARYRNAYDRLERAKSAQDYGQSVVTELENALSALWIGDPDKEADAMDTIFLYTGKQSVLYRETLSL